MRELFGEYGPLLISVITGLAGIAIGFATLKLLTPIIEQVLSTMM